MDEEMEIVLKWIDRQLSVINAQERDLAGEKDNRRMAKLETTRRGFVRLRNIAKAELTKET